MDSGGSVQLLIRAVRRLPSSRTTNRIGRAASIGLGMAGVNVVVPVRLRDGTTMVLDARGRMESEAVWTGDYDERVKKYLMAAVAVTGPNFVDVGANVGLVAVPMARA